MESPQLTHPDILATVAARARPHHPRCRGAYHRPFITSQFLPREPGDRPQVIPKGTTNLGLMGQFCELPVYGLLGLGREPPAVYQGKFDPRVLFKAYRALHDLQDA
ncbi:oleate hydratase [Methylobacterium sp. Leaf456]|uniref:oleate hydratase n=1 Tax=Methylobacterium sp. Leaf456 TaxID=1736382 RepID=UPI0009E9D9A6|nr:oleate hydratase [Methylobacterium sp. Leaf456]